MTLSCVKSLVLSDSGIYEIKDLVNSNDDNFVIDKYDKNDSGYDKKINFYFDVDYIESTNSEGIYVENYIDNSNTHTKKRRSKKSYRCEERKGSQ